MNYLHIIDSHKHTLYNSIPESLRAQCDNCKTSNETFIAGGKKYRHGRLTDDNGSIYLITDDPEIVKRTRYFSEILKAHQILISLVKKIEEKATERATAHTRRLVHNLESLNAHNIQELYNIISEDELRDTPIEQRHALVTQRLKERSGSVHKTFLNLVKNNASMKMEFSVFDKLMRGKSSKISRQPHILRRALLNVAHIFFQDFSEKGVLVSFQPCDERVMVDYETFQVAFYQLFDNALKYTLPNTDIVVDFFNDGNFIQVQMSMLSIRIEDDEIDKITQDSFCGKHAKKLGKSGKGIGMFNVLKTISLNDGKIEILNNIGDEQVMLEGNEYRRNAFIVYLPKC